MTVVSNLNKELIGQINVLAQSECINIQENLLDSGVQETENTSVLMADRFPEYKNPPLHLLTKPILDDLFKFVQQMTHTPYRYARAKNYVTVPSKKRREREGKKVMLTRARYVNHFKGNMPLAVHFLDYDDYGKENKTNWMMFDLDITGAEYCERTAIAIYNTLQQLGIPSYLYYSGGKGVHILVLFQEEIPNQAVKDFRLYLLKELGIEKYFENAPAPAKGQNDVECRPYGGWCVKLPLTCHGKTGNFCGPLEIKNDRLVTYDGNPYEYFLSMEFNAPVDVIMEVYLKAEKEREEEIQKEKERKNQENLKYSISYQAEKKAAGEKIEMKSNEEHFSRITKLINEMEIVLEGHLRKGYARFKTTLALTSYLKAKGLCRDELKEMLIDWSKRLYQNHGHQINATFDEHLSELDDIIEGTTPWKMPRLHFTTSINELICFTSSFANNSESFPIQTFRFAIALQVYAFNKTYDVTQPFRFSIAYMQNWLNMAPGTVIKARDSLIERGILEVIEEPIQKTPKRDGKMGLYRLNSTLCNHVTQIENPVYFNMASLKEKNFVGKLLCYLCESEGDLMKLLGGSYQRKRAKRMWKKYKNK